MKTVVGATVHYIQGGVHFAAMVVRTCAEDCVHLVVFPNYHDELVVGSKTHGKPATNVFFAPAEMNVDGTWHFPEWQ